MKRIIGLSVSVIMLCTLLGCGGQSGPAADSETVAAAGSETAAADTGIVVEVNEEIPDDIYPGSDHCSAFADLYSRYFSGAAESHLLMIRKKPQDSFCFKESRGFYPFKGFRLR